MSFFTDINNYVKTISNEWSLVEGSDNDTIYLINEVNGLSMIEIVYHQDLIVDSGKVKSYKWGTVDLIENGHDEATRITCDIKEIVKNNT